VGIFWIEKPARGAYPLPRIFQKFKVVALLIATITYFDPKQNPTPYEADR
jgi:hypothetical protein